MPSGVIFPFFLFFLTILEGPKGLRTTLADSMPLDVQPAPQQACWCPGKTTPDIQRLRGPGTVMAESKPYWVLLLLHSCAVQHQECGLGANSIFEQFTFVILLTQQLQGLWNALKTSVRKT